MLDVIGPLLPNWPELVEVAAKVESPNPEDDLVIKFAIVGFSLLSPTEKWSKLHWQFLEDYRASEILEEPGSSVETKVSPSLLFVCMAVGALLGAIESEKLSEEEFYLSLSQLPEFVSRHAGTIDSVETGT